MHIQNTTNTEAIPSIIHSQELYDMNSEATVLCTAQLSRLMAFRTNCFPRLWLFYVIDIHI